MKMIFLFVLLSIYTSGHSEEVVDDSLENIVTLIQRADFNREQNEFKKQQAFLSEQELLYPQNRLPDNSEMATKVLLARTFRPNPHKFKPSFLEKKRNNFKMVRDRVQIDVPRKVRGGSISATSTEAL